MESPGKRGDNLTAAKILNGPVNCARAKGIDHRENVKIRQLVHFVLARRHFWWVSAANATRIVDNFILAEKINFCTPNSIFWIVCLPRRERPAKSIGPVRR